MKKITRLRHGISRKLNLEAGRQLPEMQQPNIAVCSTFFPSRIQPWLLDSIEQIILHGGRPWIFAYRAAGTSWPDKVRRLGLLEQTCYVQAGTLAGAVTGVTRALGRDGWRSRAARRGLGHVAKSGKLPLRKPGAWGAALAVAPAIGLPGAQVIHAHSMILAYHFRLVAQIRKIPLIMTFHGLPPEGVGLLDEAKRDELFRIGSRFLVNTGFAKRQLESIGCPEEKISVIPQGVDLDDYRFSPTEPDSHRPVRLLTVGRLHPDKGHKYAIDAVRQLVAAGRDVVYRIAGVGPLREKLQEQIDDPELGGRVTLLGELDDQALRDEYANADIFVLPSLRDRSGFHEETQGVVIQEAQATGCLVVATRTGGIPECVDAGKSAWLVDDRDPDALAESIRRLIDAPGEWEKWQLDSRRWVSSHFDINSIGDRVWDVYGQEAEQIRAQQVAGRTDADG